MFQQRRSLSWCQNSQEEQKRVAIRWVAMSRHGSGIIIDSEDRTNRQLESLGVAIQAVCLMLWQSALIVSAALPVFTRFLKRALPSLDYYTLRRVGGRAAGPRHSQQWRPGNPLGQP